MALTYKSTREFILTLKCRQCGYVGGRVMPTSGNSLDVVLLNVMDQKFLHECGNDILGVCDVIGGKPQLEKR